MRLKADFLSGADGLDQDHKFNVEPFGRGLGKAARDLSGAWRMLVDLWAAAPVPEQNPALLSGYIAATARRDYLLT